MVKVKDSTDNEDANNKPSLHMAKRAKKQDIKCAICSMAIKNENAFARHMLSMHEIKVPVTCKVLDTAQWVGVVYLREHSVGKTLC